MILKQNIEPGDQVLAFGSHDPLVNKEPGEEGGDLHGDVDDVDEDEDDHQHESVHYILCDNEWRDNCLCYRLRILSKSSLPLLSALSSSRMRTVTWPEATLASRAAAEPAAATRARAAASVQRDQQQKIETQAQIRPQSKDLRADHLVLLIR